MGNILIKNKYIELGVYKIDNEENQDIDKLLEIIEQNIQSWINANQKHIKIPVIVLTKSFTYNNDHLNYKINSLKIFIENIVIQKENFSAKLKFIKKTNNLNHLFVDLIELKPPTYN